MKAIALLAACWGTCFPSYGQDFHLERYTEKDGLSDRSVSAITADHQGFLWIATAFGLNRFDGNAFEKFLTIPGDSGSIADNDIQTVYEDTRNRLWVGTNAGLSLYHPGDHSFSNYTPDSSLMRAGGINFGALGEDEAGHIWVGTKNDLLIFDPATEKFTSSGWAAFAEAPAPAGANRLRVVVTGLLPKTTGEWWVMTTYGLYGVATRSRRFVYYPYPAIKDFWGYELDYQDREGNVWISSASNHLLCYNTVSGWSTATPPPRAPAITQAVGSRHLSTHAILRAAGSTWVGTDEGLVRIMPTDSQFRFVALARPNARIQRLFHSTLNGAFFYTVYDAATVSFATRVQDEKGDDRPVVTPQVRQLHCAYQYFSEAADGTVYLNEDEHLYRYDFSLHQAIEIPLPPKLNPADVYDIRNTAIDRSGKLWIRAVRQGIIRYDPRKAVAVFDSSIPLRPNREINAMYYDPFSNTLWVAEEFNGVFVYDVGTRVITHYGLAHPGAGSNAGILAISGNAQGDLWLSDLQAGIVNYDGASRKFRRYTVHDGLASNNCRWTAPDQRGNLWIITDRGLASLDPGTGHIVNYTEEDGYRFSRDAWLTADKTGKLFLPFENGYLTWTEARARQRDGDARIYLRDIQQRNNHLTADSFYRLHYTDNSLRLLFGLLSFERHGPVILEYSLNGDAWATTDIHSYLYFASLAPGSYDLRVRIRNEPIAGMQIRFDVDRPLREKGWFITLVALLILSATILVSRARHKAVRKEGVLSQQVMESEMSALRSQMNPHFIFNTLNSINSYIIENKKEEASDYLTDFSRLMRIILDHSRLRTVALSEEMNALQLYLELESRRLEASFDYQVRVDSDIDPEMIRIPPLIIQPFVENAIWHGLRGRKSDGHVSIEVKRHESGLLILVTDNGIGREAAARVSRPRDAGSFGTAATRQRILLNDRRSEVRIEDLYDHGGAAAGTRVSIYVYQERSHG